MNKIPIDRKKRIILIKWLDSGYICPEEVRELNSEKTNMFLDLIMSIDDDEEVNIPQCLINDIKRLSDRILEIEFPTREAMEKELERLEALRKNRLITKKM